VTIWPDAAHGFLFQHHAEFPAGVAPVLDGDAAVGAKAIVMLRLSRTCLTQWSSWGRPLVPRRAPTR